MPSANFVDLMTQYARRGIDDWRQASGELRHRAQACLGTGIADDHAQACVTINAFYRGADTDKTRFRFIPMPKHPKGGIERCFFLPIREKIPSGEETAAFDLFLLVARKDCLAFRFEPAHRPSSRHAYCHVQMSRSLLRETIEVRAIPQWLPDSYPAFPINTSDPVQMFLSMAIAVHGYSGGVDRVLQDIFQKASRPGDAVVYLDEIKKVLN